jgi:hypothetical protein
MHSVRLEGALREFIDAAGTLLHNDVLTGSEVPFEVDPGTRRGAGGAALYCYRPLTGEFIAERQPAIERLASHGEAAARLAEYEGLDRYLAAAGIEARRAAPPARARMALRALLADAFAEQSDFEPRPERVRAAIERLEQAGEAGTGGVMFVATLHGLTITSEQIQLTNGLAIAHPDTLHGLPEGARAGFAAAASAGHLVAVLSLAEQHAGEAPASGAAVLGELLRALRLFGDGRVSLGALAWSRVDGGTWCPFALGDGGRPHGMLLVTPEQEDELRAFCNLVSRRAPDGDEVAWALRRFELGCARESPYEALSDDLLALRALLEPEGPDSGMLPRRLAALCATPPHRLELCERAAAAVALERAVIDGSATPHAATAALATELSDHLRALLRDVICGHLDGDLRGLADEILAERPADEAPPAHESSVEQMLGYAGEAQEILDLSV